MLTRIFKDNGMLSLLLVVGVSVSLILLKLVQTGNPGQVSDLLSAHWAFANVADLLWARQLFGALMLLVSAFLTREIGIRFKLLTTKGWLSVLTFICVALLFPEVLIRPDLVVGIVVAQVIVFLILSTHKQETALSTLFHVGMLTGFGALFYGHGILLLLLVFFSIFILRPGVWREWLMPLIGMTMTLVFLMLVLIWYPNPWQAFQQVFLSAWGMGIGPAKPYSGHMIMAILLGLSVPGALQEIASGSIRTRNGLLILMALIVVGGLMALALGLVWTEAVAWASFPIALLVCSLIEKSKVWWWADALVLVLLVATLLV